MAIPNRQLHARLRVYRADGANYVDVTPWVSRAEVNLGDVSSIGTGSSGGDGIARQMNFTLSQDVKNRFSPLDNTSDFNWVGSTFAPLLSPNREATLEVAFSNPGDPPGTYRLLFHGLMGDVIRTEGEVVEVEMRDLSKRLQDRYITESREYGASVDEGGVRADLVIQQIIDDEFGPGEIEVEVPVTPDFFCPRFKVEYQSVWDALQGVVAQFGWFIGYLYDEASNSFKLTLMEPPRDKDEDDADFHFTAEDDIFAHDLDITDRNIRNAVKVVYRDPSGERREVIATDQASIDEYGLRPMQIDEANSNLIESALQAQALADFAIKDLSDLRATTMLELPFVPEMDLYAAMTVDDERISSEVEFFGVDSVRHTLDFAGGMLSTEVMGSARVIGSFQRWLQMQTRPGSDGRPTFDVWPVRPNIVITVAAVDSEDEAKRRADIVCDGLEDQKDIMRGLSRIPDGGRILLLEGTYNITDSILIEGDRQVIEGSGTGTIIRMDDDPDIDEFDDTSIMIEVVGNAGNQSGLKNLVLDGNGDTLDPWPVQGVSIFPSSRRKEFYIQDVSIRDCTANAILTETTFLPTIQPLLIANNVTIERCSSGMLLERCEARITNSRLTGGFEDFQDGISIHRSVSVTLVNTVIEGFTGLGIVCATDAASIGIYGGSIHGDFGNMQLWNVRDISIDGATFPSCFIGPAIEIFGDFDPLFIPQNIYISNCEIIGPEATGIRIDLEEQLIDDGARIKDVEISNTQIRNPGAQGIFARGCEDILIQGCNIEETGTQGINTVQVRKMRMIGNMIHRAGQEGLLAQETIDSIITGNNFIESGHHGLSLSDFEGRGIATADNEITENRFEASSQNQNRLASNIRLFAADKNNIQSNVVRRGDLSNKPIWGIWIGSGADRNFVTNNDVYEGGDDGDIRNDSSTTVTSAGNRTSTSGTSWIYTRNYTIADDTTAENWMSLSGDGPVSTVKGANSTLIPFIGIFRRFDLAVTDGTADFDLRLYVNDEPTDIVFKVRGEPAGTVFSVMDIPIMVNAFDVLQWRQHRVGSGPIGAHSGCIVTSYDKQ